MFKELLDDVIKAANKKYGYFKTYKFGYFLSSMWAGAAIGLGIILIAVIGAYGEKYQYAMTKAVMGFSFSMALSVVLMFGVELFTGNNLLMSVAGLERKVSWIQVLYLWIFNYVGNFGGALVLALIYANTGVASGLVGDYLVQMAVMKTDPTFIELLMKGILCNVLVCLAVLIALKMKSESGKLIMIFWCIYTFITCGFEHSIANMTLFSLSALLDHGATVSYSMMIHNLIPVTIGNIIGGGLMLGGSLHLMAKK